MLKLLNRTEMSKLSDISEKEIQLQLIGNNETMPQKCFKYMNELVELTSQI